MVKSSRSGCGNNNCVEVGLDPQDQGGHVLVRDSKDKFGPVLRIDRRAWRHFIDLATSVTPPA